ncbi:quinone oxidoreductase family protein [Levilactobacillus bambusae]|uniref:NADP-dependent oxidoreductase n=1 Tax=Levilactobacillus bambusae TaxID=2024736 RepID=A0A2V1MZD0_9LACO|nr:NADP-dependent oxidoreductase [Levilactobacillus bambusae]PWG00374.1 NADP-dependent oxidoreductase [Levilactobacillus bambusae]
MKAVGYTKTGDPSVLELIETPNLRAKRWELVVEVDSVGLNNFEQAQRNGSIPASDRTPAPTDTHPAVIGSDIVGKITEVGAGVTGFEVGQTIIGHTQRGYAEQAIVRQDDAVLLPPNLSPDLAAASITPGITAYNAVHYQAQVKINDVVVIRGAAGGVGSIALQLVHTIGAKVIAIVGRHSIDAVKRMGADDVIAYDDPNLDLTAYNQSADIVLNFAMNGAGGDQDVKFLRDGGRLVSVAMKEPLDGRAVEFQHIHPQPNHVMSSYKHVLDLMEAGKVTIKIGAKFPFTLQGFIDGHKLLDQKHDGRIVVTHSV